MKLLNGTWLACLVGAVALASACGDSGDDDNPAKGGSSGSGGSKGGSGGSKGGTGGDTGGGTGGDTGGATGGTGKGGSSGKGGTGGDTAGDAGMGNEGGGGGAPPEACNIYDTDRPVEDIPTDSMGNVDFGSAATMTLANDKTWRINGRIYVPAGKTLEIGPCTLVVGTPKPNAGTLFVMRGAKLNSIGTADEPVVFSSHDYKYTSTARWGGVVLLGRAPIGMASGSTGTPERIFEGLSDARATYGGTDANDNSGTVQYTRIEYGGDIIVADKEINGLTMGGVGSGTTLDHIMVKRQGDDCFEWFGGTVNADHLICENTGDDMFDTDEKYIGHLQFLFGRLTTTGTSADPNGFEWDGNQAWTSPFMDPMTDHEVDGGTPHAANATLCGLGANAGVVAHGAVLRRDFNTAGGTLIRNTIITGFNDGYDTRDNVGTNAMPIIAIDHSLFFENGFAGTNVIAPAETGAANDLSFDELAFFALAGSANAETKPAGFNCYSNPPHPFPNTSVAGIAAGAGFKTPAADYIGAFEDADDNWMTGMWVDWSSGN
jgi:hypothetical protein